MSEETRGAPKGNSNASQYEGVTQSARVGFRTLPFFHDRWTQQAKKEGFTGHRFKEWVIKTLNNAVEE